MRSLAAFVVLTSSAGLGCGGHDDDNPAQATPAATSIPMGAPGAEGASFDPTPPPKPKRGENSTEIEEKINPEPGTPPGVPPSPFGLPPTAPDEPTAPTTKKSKGTKI